MTKRTGSGRGRRAGGAAARATLPQINEVWTANGNAPLTFSQARELGLVTAIVDLAPGLIELVNKTRARLREEGKRATDKDALVTLLTSYAESTGRDPSTVLAAELATYQKELATMRRATRTATKGRGKALPAPTKTPLDEWAHGSKRKR